MRLCSAAYPALQAVFLGARRALINPLIVLIVGLAAIAGARADNVTGDIAVTTDQGYGRMVFTFSEEIKTKVDVADGIVIIQFEKPVAIATEKPMQRLSAYVQAVRRDPDNRGIRLALGRKVTVNVMNAAEKVFIDLLPDDWIGLPPGLPQQVVDELARRAREAEHRAKMNLAGERKTWAPVRLRFASAPTFARFGFEMSEPIAIATVRDGQELRITFDAPVKIEFGETKARLPLSVVGLDADYQSDMTVVKLVLAPDADVRTFRDDTAFNVDVTPPAQLPAPKNVEGSAAPAVPPVSVSATEAPSADSAPISKELAAIEPPAAAPQTPAVTPEPPPASVPPAVAAATPAPAPMAAPEVPVSSEAPAAPEIPVVKAEPNQPAAAKSADESVSATLARYPGKITITLPFGEPVSGALFRRGDFVWIVLDTSRPVHLAELMNDASHLVRGIEQSELPNGQIIKLKLDRNRLASLEGDGQSWIISVGGTVAAQSRPLPARRVFVSKDRAGILVPLASPARTYTLNDPDIGDNLVVVTAQLPARGMVRGQEFVDFDALPAMHGVVVAPKADDLTVELSLEGVTVSRPGGLTVSDMSSVLPPLPERSKFADRPVTALEPGIWRDEQDAPFFDRETALARALAESPLARRADRRIALARFYLARDLASEAIGTLEAGSQEEAQSGPESSFVLLHALAELKLGRPDQALADLNKSAVARLPQAALLRASALAGLTRWPEARDQYNAGSGVVETLPLDVQRLVLTDALRTAIEVSDFAGAGSIRNDFEVIGIPKELEPTIALLTARLAQGIGRSDQAISDYAAISDGPEGPAMAEARLRLIEMRINRGDFDRGKTIDALETLSYAWRGDETEVQTMHRLANLYLEEARYRDAFNLLDAAMLVRPESETTRSFYGEMAAVFEDLFLSDKGNSVSPIESLAIYYDFSKLTPIGRRGDELIRRLADRLVAVDLLDQAAELLDYQVQFRLTGAAKAQVAAKLAWVYLMNAKPAEAIKVLANTRQRDLPQDLREQRLLLEARGLSETGRFDPAIDLIAGVASPEGDRLRADILWTAKRWRESGDAFEKLLGDRWQRPAVLDETERQDVLRAALAFALGNESIGLARLRDRYAAKMPEGKDRDALDIVTASGNKNPKMIGEVAKTLSAVDSLKLFLRLYQARFPDKPLPENTDTQKLSAR